jgi:hypothetical protein
MIKSSLFSLSVPDDPGPDDGVFVAASVTIDDQLVLVLVGLPSLSFTDASKAFASTEVMGYFSRSGMMTMMMCLCRVCAALFYYLKKMESTELQPINDNNDTDEVLPTILDGSGVELPLV